MRPRYTQALSEFRYLKPREGTETDALHPNLDTTINSDTLNPVRGRKHRIDCCIVKPF